MNLRIFKSLITEATRDFEKAKVREKAGIKGGKFSSKSSTLDSDIEGSYGSSNIGKDEIQTSTLVDKYKDDLKKSVFLFKKYGFIDQEDIRYDNYVENILNNKTAINKYIEEEIVEGIKPWIAALEEIESPQGLMNLGARSFVSKVIYPNSDSDYGIKRKMLRVMNTINKHSYLFPSKSHFGKFKGGYAGEKTFIGGEQPIPGEKEFKVYTKDDDDKIIDKLLEALYKNSGNAEFMHKFLGMLKKEKEKRNDSLFR